jgi:hypothetical protein
LRIALAMVTRKPDHQEHEAAVKTIVQGMPEGSGGPSVELLVRFFILRARLRARWSSGIPCAL